MAMSFSFLICYLLLSIANEGHAATWSDLSAEIEKLLAIHDFDDSTGIIDINTYFSMQWTEEVYFNAHGSTAPNTSVTISASSIWKTSLILVRIHLKSSKCELTENVIFKASCKPNDILYPFDIHECSLTLTARAYTSSELTLIVSSFREDYFEKSVSWSLRDKYSDTLIQDSKSIAKFQIIIRRKAANYVLNYLVPVAILSGLNPFVFILTRRSGERAGFSVTCFLAFVVLMNTTVPSSKQSSLLMYYLNGVMITSASITLTVCFTVAIDENLKRIAKDCRLCCNRCRLNQVTTENQQEQRSDEDGANYKTAICCDVTDCIYCMCCICHMCKSRKCTKKLKWDRVRDMVDVSFFYFFLIIEVGLFITFITIMGRQYSAEIEKLNLEHPNT
ncbi:hypothetical protein ACJMK2_041071 [Sinanodonta woodiana]|uniref:Neurotransmitter-gated ion-channel ligand-binding domain-containing protein n=1 Tax=Sinanodonta woodiana TaxID=1069815 RepID=A0ABD3W6P4_SINWO